MVIQSKLTDQFMIVGLVGHMNSGKTTAARWFTMQGFHEIGFSFSMKEAMRAMAIPLTRENMQRFGTETMRERWDQDIWVKALANRIEKLWENVVLQEIVDYTGVIIPDVRFINELDWIMEQGGFLLGLRADLEILFQRALKRQDRDPPKTYGEFLTQLEHPSERQIDALFQGCHWILDSNHKNPQELFRTLATFWPTIEEFFKDK